MLRLAVKPKGKEGVIMFVKSYKRNWLFRKKLVLTPLLGEAMICKTNIEITKLYDEILANNNGLKLSVWNELYVEYQVQHHQFYIIAKHTKKGLEYYCSEKQVYDKKLMRRVQAPEFTTDINKAEFSKSLDNAKSILTRMRLTGGGKVTAYSVFMTLENDLQMRNIIFVLTNKNTKKTRYLKKYDLNGKSSDRVQMCDYMDRALVVKYDEALKIYDDLHAKHKNFLVNLHIRKKNENTPAKDLVCKQESIRVGFKLSV